MLVDHDMRRSKTKKLRDNHEKLIVIALLNYEHQFMRNLHTMSSKSQTQALYLDFILYNIGV